MSKPTLAVALIVKNESKHLAACLDTVKDWVDEIIILDSGSTDDTAEIAHRYTDKFFVHAEWQGFGIQRQLAQQYVSSDYILWLDADERITAPLQQNIIEAISYKPNNTAYTLPRLSWVFGRYIRHCGWYPDRVLRLYPTQLTQYNDSLVHEKVIIPTNMNIKPLSGDLIHFTYDDIHHYLLKSASYAKAWAEQKQRQGKKGSLVSGFTHAIGCFLKMYIVKQGFLDGKQGLLLSILSAHSTFVKYADLWVRTKTTAQPTTHEDQSLNSQ